MYALRSTAGVVPTYAKFCPGNLPVWGPVETSTKFPSESVLLVYVLRTPPMSAMFVKGPLDIAELDYEKGKLRYRLPDGVRQMQYGVRSKTSGEKAYTVRVNEAGDGSCTCPDFKYRHAEDGMPCKHMQSVLSHLPTMRGDVYFDLDFVGEDF